MSDRALEAAVDDEQWFTDETSEHPDQPPPAPPPEEEPESIGMLEQAAREIRRREDELRKVIEER
jgi:hypothetical protein